MVLQFGIGSHHLNSLGGGAKFHLDVERARLAHHYFLISKLCLSKSGLADRQVIAPRLDVGEVVSP